VALYGSKATAGDWNPADQPQSTFWSPSRRNVKRHNDVWKTALNTGPHSPLLGARLHDGKQFYEHQERWTNIALKLVHKHLVQDIKIRNSFVNTERDPPKSSWSLYTNIWCTAAWWGTVSSTQRTVDQNRPEARIQAFGAQQHDGKQFDQHKERSTKIAPALLYKDLVHNHILRNSCKSITNDPRKSHRCLYTSIRCTTLPWEAAARI
jgi:hypothetical protein